MNYQDKQNIIQEYKDLYSSDLETLKSNFYKIFPNGKIGASIYSGIGDPVFSITFVLIGNDNDQSNRIIDNDPVITKFISHLPMVHPTKDTVFQIERLMGDLYVQPPENSFLAMGRVKLPYRKSTGTMTKQIQNLTKYFKFVGQSVLDNKDNLAKKDIDKKYLNINLK